ncbi:hypothetical protein BDV32DRAFT_92284 [Aspergillus pseudonomiae]|uniref:Uncharacterized protein n=1 Tax=Aspergillus pseudonomiae TaxID=1506151 RepID=A0A5N6IE49_9EURO|nr:uncharacterized protein BDV37DRAFT_84517 [Aspergillus pseudonomiae]KAB8264079.1 hypothetical protein BDV32DRAFT_92284 [Aspergillus pseudonomiae]KAE8405917.1 hypothetical protein BDV37DRAFT_84517 [Aspergillus pseudonomiae]
MESILRRKGTSMNRRGSISQLLHIQKPTFSVLQEQPTRYYDFVDSPGYNEPSSPSTHRQYISPELESDIRYACSLLVYRIERGVPSPPANQSSKPSTRMGNEKGEHSSAGQGTTEPQIDSKYFSPKVGAEVAALKDKLDSGVGLTQQPSRQTMRLLKSSHSDACPDSAERTSGSLLSQVRSTTSGSDTSRTETPNSQSLVKGPPLERVQSMMGSPIGATQTKDQDTMSFLAGMCNSGLSTDEALEEEVFLNPDLGLDSNGIPSFTSPSAFLSSTSPSFGVSSGLTQGRQPELIAQPRLLGERPGTTAGLDSPQSGKGGNEPGVIIDGNGFAHILTVAEEAQRNLDLQQAVMAKMKANATDSNSNALPQTPKQALLHKNPQSEHQTIPSRHQTSWSHRSKATTLNWKPHTETPSSSNNKPNLFQKITGFFKTRRGPGQANHALVEQPFGITH